MNIRTSTAFILVVPAALTLLGCDPAPPIDLSAAAPVLSPARELQDSLVQVLVSEGQGREPREVCGVIAPGGTVLTALSSLQHASSVTVVADGRRFASPGLVLGHHEANLAGLAVSWHGHHPAAQPFGGRTPEVGERVTVVGPVGGRTGPAVEGVVAAGGSASLYTVTLLAGPPWGWEGLVIFDERGHAAGIVTGMAMGAGVSVGTPGVQAKRELYAVRPEVIEALTPGDLVRWAE